MCRFLEGLHMDGTRKKTTFLQSVAGKSYSADKRYRMLHEKVTDNVKAVIKVGEINYEKYKDLNSSMEHVLNLLIQLRAEIQRPREGCSSINTDHVVETVLSRLSSELITKDKEMNSMLSKQRKEIEENIQRTSDEWFLKYKELTTHLDNLEVEAQNNFQKVSEQQNNTMVQQRKDSELTNSKISDMSCEVQNLQDKVMQLTSTVAANETKMSEEFAKNSELLKASILKLSTIEITKSLKDPIQKIKENSSKISKVEKKNVELEQRLLNSTDVIKRDISEISITLQVFEKRLDTGSSTLAPKKQISAINDAQIKKTNSELSSESRKNTTKQIKTSPDKSEEKEQATSNEQDMRKKFTRLVADRLKPPEDSSAFY
ncbi:uncharacterized protein LOC131957469 [Physella acuta]|uniref:uncharacterized protein LOC131957469 n=1 Tax=Physella acuta TaxID=109671 RepID=UPI0027DE8338|nr:uncharacterized protein LOC131957469 [Physella acuta]